MPTPPEVVEQIQAATAAPTTAPSLPSTSPTLPGLPDGGSIAGDLSTLGTIINLGEDVWAVIKDNAPVVNVSHDYASAVPSTVTSAAALSGFSDLQYHSYRLYGVNGFGATVYDVVYTVVHQYGGSLNGTGKYLATVSIVPSKVDVLWGYKVNLNVVQASTTNVGTAAAPVAAVNMEINFSVASWFRSDTNTTVMSSAATPRT